MIFDINPEVIELGLGWLAFEQLLEEFMAIFSGKFGLIPSSYLLNASIQLFKKNFKLKLRTERHVVPLPFHSL